MKRRIVFILYAKPPVKGFVKTRLAKTIGEQGALEFYKHMLIWQGKLIRSVLKDYPASKAEIHLAIPESLTWKKGKSLVRQTLCSAGISARKIKFRQQSAGNLGDRMKNSFENAFKKAERVIIWGSDIPLMNRKTLEEAASETISCLVPATDGGYSLIAFSRSNFNAKVFEKVPWSTTKTYELQKEQLKKTQILFKELPPIPDLDTVEDIAENIRFIEKNAQFPEYQPILSDLRKFLEEKAAKN